MKSLANVIEEKDKEIAQLTATLETSKKETRGAKTSINMYLSTIFILLLAQAFLLMILFDEREKAKEQVGSA